MLLDKSYFDEAKITDLDNWKSKNVYKEISCQNRKPLHVGCVCCMKQTNKQ